jgi:hypothetical protein
LVFPLLTPVFGESGEQFESQNSMDYLPGRLPAYRKDRRQKAKTLQWYKEILTPFVCYFSDTPCSSEVSTLL